MSSDLEIWDQAAGPWAEKVTRPGSLRSVHLKNATDALIGEVSGKDILDAGCGDGVFANYLSSLKANVTAIDGSQNMVAAAKVKYPNLKLALADLLKPLPFVDQSFDLILSNMVLMHLAEIKTFLSQANRTLRPKGILIFSILHPAFNFPTMKLYKSLLAKLTMQKPSGLAFDYFQTETSRRFEANLGQELTHYHRTLEDYSKALNANGFSINIMLEPHALTSEFLRDNPKLEYTTRLPRFLFFKCTKHV